jgi:hypothetical protein
MRTSPCLSRDTCRPDAWWTVVSGIGAADRGCGKASLVATKKTSATPSDRDPVQARAGDRRDQARPGMGAQSHHALPPSRCPENRPALVGCRIRANPKLADSTEPVRRETTVQP